MDFFTIIYVHIFLKMMIPIVNRVGITLRSAEHSQQSYHLSHLFEPHTKYLSTATLIVLPTRPPKVSFFLNRAKTLLYQVQIKTKHQEITSVRHVSLWFSLYLLLSLLAKGLAACYSVSWDPTQLLLSESHSSSLIPRVPRPKMALYLTRHELFLQRSLLQES